MPCKMNQREGREKKWDGNFSPEWNGEKKHCKLLGRDGKIGSNLSIERCISGDHRRTYALKARDPSSTLITIFRAVEPRPVGAELVGL